MLAQLEVVAAEEGEAKRLRLASEQQQELDGWAMRRREQLERLIEVSDPPEGFQAGRTRTVDPLRVRR